MRLISFYVSMTLGFVGVLAAIAWTRCWQCENVYCDFHCSSAYGFFGVLLLCSVCWILERFSQHG